MPGCWILGLDQACTRRLVRARPSMTLPWRSMLNRTEQNWRGGSINTARRLIGRLCCPLSVDWKERGTFENKPIFKEKRGGICWMLIICCPSQNLCNPNKTWLQYYIAHCPYNSGWRTFQYTRKWQLSLAPTNWYASLERDFSLLAWAAKPSETQIVYWGSRPSKYQRNLLLLNFSDETGAHDTTQQFMKVRRQKKKRKEKKWSLEARGFARACAEKLMKVGTHLGSVYFASI